MKMGLHQLTLCIYCSLVNHELSGPYSRLGQSQNFRRLDSEFFCISVVFTLFIQWEESQFLNKKIILTQIIAFLSH